MTLAPMNSRSCPEDERGFASPTRDLRFLVSCKRRQRSIRPAAAVTAEARQCDAFPSRIGPTGLVDMADTAVKDACAWLQDTFAWCDARLDHAITHRTDFGR